MAEEKGNKAQESSVEQLVVESILERPITFALDDDKGKLRYFYVYPPSLGISFLSADLLKKLQIDHQLLKVNQQIEMFRLCTEQREDVLRLITIHTFQRRSDAIREEKVKERMKELQSLDAAELSTLLLAIMDWQSYYDKFIKHFGIDKERKDREKISRIKEDDSSSVTFGGNSIYGSLLDHACERYKWELGYVVWGISITNLNMMLADSVQSVYLTEKERKQAHIHAKGTVIKADDPKNAALVKAFFESIKHQ